MLSVTLFLYLEATKLFSHNYQVTGTEDGKLKATIVFTKKLLANSLEYHISVTTRITSHILRHDGLSHHAWTIFTSPIPFSPHRSIFGLNDGLSWNS